MKLHVGIVSRKTPVSLRNYWLYFDKGIAKLKDKFFFFFF